MQCVVINGDRFIATKNPRNGLWSILRHTKRNNVRVASGIQGKSAKEALANWQLTLPGSQNA
jgi:hypothetical protein